MCPPIMGTIEQRQVTGRFQLSEDSIAYSRRSKRLSRDQISGYPRMRVRGSRKTPPFPTLDLGFFDSDDLPRSSSACDRSQRRRRLHPS
ncbi:hypothetical protein LA080_011435 [Diaporthe eres]|nr:hypothetical protein LA080_011435 [Diaporthe eres]